MTSQPIPSRTFYFIRHGETQFNLERRFQGSGDIPLNETGMQQAKRAAELLSGHLFSRIVASPARRVVTTANLIAEIRQTPIHLEKDLMEFNVGSFEGRRIKATMKQHGLESHASLLSVLPEDAENWHEFAPRVCTAVSRWTNRYADETLLIASHGLVFRALTERLMGTPLISENAVPYRFSLKDNSWDLTQLE